MKKVELHILTFGIAKDIVGKQLFNMEIHENSTVEELRKKLFSYYPELKKLKSLSIAVNNEYVPDNFILNFSDEIALIPPVSGG